MTQTITIETQVPQDIYQTLQANGVFHETLAERSRQLLALHFYQERILSLGQAARLARVSRWAFIDLLADNNIPTLDYSHEELEAEFEAAKQLQADLST